MQLNSEHEVLQANDKTFNLNFDSAEYQNQLWPLIREMTGRKQRWDLSDRAKSLRKMVGPGGLEPLTSSVSRKRSNQTELRAYMQTAVTSILRVASD